MAHIVIIGSGASGLMAAYTLLKRSYTVTLLEARDRTGGRIHTLQSPFSIPVETGAEFIHGDQPITRSLIEASASEAVLLTGNHYRLKNGKVLQGDLLENEWRLIMERLHALEDDITIDDFLQQYFNEEQYKSVCNEVKRFAEGFDLADTSKASAFALREEWQESDDEHQYHITGGYQRIIEYLEKEVKSLGGKFMLSTIVREIQWSTGKVKVLTADSKSLHAEKVIVTVPLGVLKKKMIRFTPSLPKHEQAFEQMGFGSVVKFLIEFEATFWKDNIVCRLHNASFIFSDAEIPTWWTQLPDAAPILTGWLGGPVTQTVKHDPTALFENAIRSLQAIFSCPETDIEKNIRHWQIVDWGTDPFSQGAYSYATVQTAQALELISKPVDDTIYFVGEACYQGTAIGTVEAALISGKEVGEKFIN